MSSPQLLQVLSKLIEGHSVVLRFPSSREWELFRQAIYKVKKSWDTEMVQLDDTWIVKQLKTCTLVNKDSELITEHDVKLWLTVPRPRGFQFEILEDTPLVE